MKSRYDEVEFEVIEFISVDVIADSECVPMEDPDEFMPGGDSSIG